MSKAINWDKNKYMRKDLEKRLGGTIKRATDKQKSFLRDLKIEYSENIISKEARILISTALHGPILSKTETRDLISSKKNEIEDFLRRKEKTP